MPDQAGRRATPQYPCCDHCRTEEGGCDWDGRHFASCGLCPAPLGREASTSTGCAWVTGCEQPPAYTVTYSACGCGAVGPCTALVCIDHAAEERTDANLGLVSLAAMRSLR